VPAAARLAVRVSPADVGRRVTVRHTYEGTTLTDVVGRLAAWDDGVLAVERRDGTLVEVPVADVAAAKVVPPEVSAEDLQRVAQAGWIPWETEALGDWELRASGGITGRANSVRVAGSPGLPLPDALAVVERWYAERGLPPLLQLPVPTVHDDALEARGWALARRTVLRTGEVPGLLSGGTAADGVVLERHDVPGPEFLELVEPGLDPEGVTRLLTAPDRVVHVEARSGGELLGTGRGSVTAAPSGRWLGVTSIATAPSARRRGIARAVMAELGRWAEEQGATRVLLQTLATNEAAGRLYDALGVLPHHGYEYRSPTPGAVSPL
jgi:GNAT superfamily N-acetyltransferase